MNDMDFLQDILETEMTDQILYNQYMLQVTNPAVRQFFIQFRDEHMQNISQLQQQIKELKNNPSKQK